MKAANKQTRTSNSIAPLPKTYSNRAPDRRSIPVGARPNLPTSKLSSKTMKQSPPKQTNEYFSLSTKSLSGLPPTSKSPTNARPNKNVASFQQKPATYSSPKHSFRKSQPDIQSSKRATSMNKKPVLSGLFLGKTVATTNNASFRTNPVQPRVGTSTSTRATIKIGKQFGSTAGSSNNAQTKRDGAQKSMFNSAQPKSKLKSYVNQAGINRRGSADSKHSKSGMNTSKDRKTSIFEKKKESQASVSNIDLNKGKSQEFKIKDISVKSPIRTHSQTVTAPKKKQIQKQSPSLSQQNQVAKLQINIDEIVENNDKQASLTPMSDTTAAGITQSRQKSLSPNVDLPPVKKLDEIKEEPDLPGQSSENFIQEYGEKMYGFEIQELKIIDRVYFGGNILTRSAMAVAGERQNEDQIKKDMDDEEGYYEVAIGDHIMYRFEVKAILGKGSFAQVVKCMDHKLGIEVAVKVTRNTEIDHKFAASEAKLLNYLMGEDTEDEYGIVRLYEDFHFRDHHCFSFELLATDLFEFMKERNFEGFTTLQIRKMAIQILRALAFFEERNLIHCDLKPENIVVVDKDQLEIKLVDFGSGCFVNEQVYTYVQSRFYRAPEVVLRMNYTERVDMWSFGCILAELYTGEPMFPGNNEQEQIEYIMELCGIIPEEVVAKSRKKDQYFDEDYSPFLIEEEGIGILRIPASRTLEDAVNQCPDNDFLDFIAECLIIEPEKRISAKDAMNHPWIKEGLNDYAPKKRKLMHARIREVDVPMQAQIESPTKLIRTITNADESVKIEKKKKKKREYELVKQNVDLDNWGEPEQQIEDVADGSGTKVQKITVTIYKRK